VPLDKSCSLEAFQSNVSAAYKEGKRAQGTQHVAIALSTLKRACGVADDDRKMTAKEIVAAGSKKESQFVRLFALVEREPAHVGPDWFSQARAASRSAMSEAHKHQRGPGSEKLIGLVQALLQTRRAPPVFENRTLRPGADNWDGWIGWTSRVMFAVENMAIPELSALIRAFARGEVKVPALAERIGFGRGIDFAVRSSAHGAATSPSSAPPEANSGANAGTFRVYADNGDIKSGDGRAPKKRKR
jgi:hypothetical protein